MEDAADLGAGEWIEFELPQGTHLKLICIVNGYTKDQHLYEANGVPGS